jgi:bacterioferritin-associated ferredoxin
MRIDRCVCRRFSFADLLPLARERGWALPDVMRETGCADECGLCRPYIRRMLSTGETVFSDLLEDSE